MKRLWDVTLGSRLFRVTFFMLMAILLAIKLYDMNRPAVVATSEEVKEEENDAEEESESLERANPDIMRIINGHTRATPWRSHEVASHESAGFSSNKKVRLNENLTMLVPDQADEESVQEESNAAQTEFALQHFSPEALDLLYQEYKQNGESLMGMLEMLGIKKNCDAAAGSCEYIVGEKSALIASLNNRLKAGDRIVSLNGNSVDTLHSYEEVKSAFFRESPTMLQVRETDNNLRQVYIPHGKMLPSYYN